MAILQDTSKPTYEQLMDIIAEQQRLLAEKRAGNTVSFKISPNKGCVMVCGLSRIPTVLYASQWLRILEHGDKLKAFIETNRPQLAWKA